MSACTSKIPLAVAREEAGKFRALFDGCHRTWVLAGSIRRNKPEVSDIDHVVIPVLCAPVAPVSQPVSEGLFGAEAPAVVAPVSKPVNWMRRRAEELLATGTLTLHDYSAPSPHEGEGRGEGGVCGTGFQPVKKTRCGDKLMGLHFNGRKHEIWMCEPGNYGPTLAIRTGPADFSKQLVIRVRRTGHLQHEGWLHQRVGGQYALHRPPEHPNAINQLYGWYAPIACETEEQYFAAAGFDKFIEPEDRV